MAEGPSRPRHRHDFKIAIICAMPLEAEMVELVFDKFWDDHGEKYGKALGDQNTYTTGVIGEHNVVLTYMPGIGSNNAAVVAAGLRSSFRGIEITFVVGICGAVPYHISTKEEIILGDCIISTAVVQYDFGRQYPDGFIRKNSVEDSLGRANLEVRSLTAMLMTRRNRRRLTERLAYHLEVLQNLESDVEYPGAERDRLFEPFYTHEHRSGNKTCDRCLIGSATCLKDCDAIDCGKECLIIRKRLSKLSQSASISPMVHFGRFGSANTVMKSGLDRDLLAQDGGVIAFEMEGSGVWDNFATIVVKSACDYADSHKSKEWQAYAAATAAAGLKALLEKWETSEDTFRNALPEQYTENKNHQLTTTTIAHYEGSPKISTGKGGNQEHFGVIQQLEDSQKDEQRLLLEQAFSYEGKYCYQEAETCYEQVLVTCQKAFGPRHVETLWILDNLGRVCSYQIKYEKAAAFYRTSLQAKEEILGPTHESTLATMHSLGVLLKDQDKFDEAETMSRRALRGREQTLGPQNISTLDTLESLGILFKILDKFEESERMLLRALHGKEKMLGPQSVTTLATVSHLGELYVYLDRFDEAEKMFIRVLQGREKTLGPQHRLTLQTACDLGAVHSYQRRSDQTEAMLERVLLERGYFSGPQGIMTRELEHRLGRLYRHTHRYDEAEDVLVKVVQTRKEVLGPKHTAVLATLGSLARVYHQQGKILEAEELFREILQSYEEIFGPKHTRISNIARILGRIYKAQKRFQIAEKMHVRALQGYKEILGEEHVSTLDAAVDLATVYYHEGNLGEAERVFNRALQDCKEALGEKHSSILNATQGLAHVYYKQGKRDQARNMFIQARQGYEEVFGAADPSTVYTSEMLHRISKMPDNANANQQPKTGVHKDR